ncbi:MAG: IS21 family transposase [Lentisphaerae bacterium]|nr:IS21 family transposase [Lentisphaerota bacterium]
MSGKPITEQQIRIYMSAKNQGYIQPTAAAKAGISERSGRRIEKGEIITGGKPKRTWRTRKDPFGDVWENEIVPMLEQNPKLQPLTLFEQLNKKYPGCYPQSKLRTFQRKVKKWKAMNGPDKEVMFLQRKIPGRMGLSDFTTLNKVRITINGEPLNHLLYHFRLIYSGWCHVKVILGGESFPALSEGLQDALWRLGGVPREHRTDSLSAAFKNMKKDAKEDVTIRYEELFNHYDLIPTRNNRGKGHENGGIESPHGHLKNRIHQALLIRSSADFESVSAYQRWIDTIVGDINTRNRDKISQERVHLKPLPLQRTLDYTEKVVGVSTTSTIIVNRVVYTVPSRLIGEKLRVHIYHDRIEAYLGTTHAISLPRHFSPGKNRRGRCVDYRHVIGSLERKPQAFRYSQLRDDLLPSDTYRLIWERLDRDLDPRAACKAIVGILSLANRAECEEELGAYILAKISNDHIPTLGDLQKRFEQKEIAIPEIDVLVVSGKDYNILLSDCQPEGVC